MNPGSPKQLRRQEAESARIPGPSTSPPFMRYAGRFRQGSDGTQGFNIPRKRPKSPVNTPFIRLRSLVSVPLSVPN